jgi:DNA-binding NarL/FixJ family response regulator
MQSGKIKILIADDHAILRQGLKRILDAEPDMTVIGEASTGIEAVKRTRQLKPDIVIMDISMPEQDGIESLRQIVKTVSSRVVILSVHLEHQVISEAVAAGASGYLAKDSLDTELVSAVRTVVQGAVRCFLPMSLAYWRNRSRAAPAPPFDRSNRSPAANERFFFSSPKEKHQPKSPHRFSSAPRPCIRTGSTFSKSSASERQRN